MAYNQHPAMQHPPQNNRYYNEQAQADYPPPLPPNNNYQQGYGAQDYGQDVTQSYDQYGGNPYADAGNPYANPAQPQYSRGPPPQGYDPRQQMSAPPRQQQQYQPPPNPPRPQQQYPPSQQQQQQRSRTQPPPAGRRGPPPPQMYQNGNMPPQQQMQRPGQNGPPPPRGRTMPPPNGMPMPRPGPGMQDDHNRARSGSRGRFNGNGGNRAPDMYNGFAEPGPYGQKPMMPPNGNVQGRAPASRGRDAGPMMPPPPRTESRPGSSRRPFMDDQVIPQRNNADNPFPPFPSKTNEVRPSFDQPRPNFEQQQRPSMDRPRPDFDRPRPSFGDRAQPIMDQRRPGMPPNEVSSTSLTSNGVMGSPEIYNGIVHEYARDDSRDRGGQQQAFGASSFNLPDRSLGHALPYAAGGNNQGLGQVSTQVEIVGANQPWLGNDPLEFYDHEDTPEAFEMPADVPVELPAQESSFQKPPITRARTASPGPVGHGQPILNPALNRVGYAGSHYSDPGTGVANTNGMRPPQPPQGRGPAPGGFSTSQGPGYNPRMGPPSSQVYPGPGGPPPRPGMQDRGYSNGSQTRNGERPGFYRPTNQALPQPPPIPPPQPTSPDALPYHATPLDTRVGKTQPPQATATSPGAQQSSKPPPIRQYNSGGPDGTRRQSEPAITHASLAKLQELARANPNDNATQLKLAKALVEASTTLAPSDPKARVAQASRYNSDALKLVRMLATRNDPEAIFFLADCHGDGRMGLEIDPKEAFTLYQNAGKIGHSGAAYRTAVCCEIGPEEGGGTRKDPLKAFQWYKRAATLGDVPAMYKMGIILLKGLLGQEKDINEAVHWLRKAADGANEENPHALHELGLLYETPPPATHPTQQPPLFKDDVQALALFTSAAKLGYKYSQFKLGQAFEYGLLGCPIKARDSIIWYTKAAAQGEHQSELALSGWYLTGSEGILEHSDTEAYLWARKAAMAQPPLPKAMFAMGYFTEVGIGCPRSLEEAKRWYGRAAAYRFPKAQDRLDELRKGGAAAAPPGGARGGPPTARDHREKLTRKDQKKDETECTVM